MTKPKQPTRATLIQNIKLRLRGNRNKELPIIRSMKHNHLTVLLQELQERNGTEQIAIDSAREALCPNNPLKELTDPDYCTTCRKKTPESIPLGLYPDLRICVTCGRNLDVVSKKDIVERLK